MTHATRFRDRLFTEIAFGTRHLEPLRKLYRLARAGDLPRSQHFNVVTGLHDNMAWHYAANPRTLEPFGTCLRASNLRRSLAIVGADPKLYAACFIVIAKELPELEFHIDFGEDSIPAGVSSTMLTPLFPFEPGFGHLEYREDGEQLEYRYELGKAILFDGKFEHRSQSFRAKSSTERVLVSWSVAATDRRYRPAIRRVIDSQTGKLAP